MAKVASKVPHAIENPWHLFLAVAPHVRRILLHGETPGTGKTSAGIALAAAKEAEAVVITMRDNLLESDLLGHWMPRGKNEVTWHDGPVGYAIRRATDGHKVVLVFNELDHASPDATHAAYSLLEDAASAAARFTLPSGEVLTIPETLTIVATQNPDPKETLPLPVLNRFQVVLDIGSHVSPMILEALPEKFRSMVADGRLAAREAFAMLSLVAEGCDPYIATQAVLGADRFKDYGDALAISLAS